MIALSICKIKNAFKKNVHELFLAKRKRSWFYIFIWLMISVAILYINFFSDLYAKMNTLIVVVACIRLLRWWWSAGIHRLTTAQQSVGGCRSQKTPGFGCLLSWNKALILHTQKHQSPILMKKSSQFVNTFSYHSPSYPDWSEQL